MYKYVQTSGRSDKTISGLVKLVQAFLNVSNVGESQFKPYGGAVQTVQACLRVGKVPQSHLNH